MSSGPTWSPSLSKKPFVQKGDIAPPDFQLMSIVNPGGLNLSWFNSGPTFVELALKYLASPHVRDIALVPLPFRPPSVGPDSIRYLSLAEALKVIGVVEELPPGVVPRIILPLFAVVKDCKAKLARPIENGHPIRGLSGNEVSIHVPAAFQIVNALLSSTLRYPEALTFDLANYYFQIKNMEPSFHGFRCGKRHFIWKVLTMGWSDACFIAQSFTAAIILRASPHPVERNLLVQAAPPGVFHLGSALIFIVYDSVLILDLQVTRWKSGINRCATEARACLKYIFTSSEQSIFTYCGFQLRFDASGLSWRVDPDTILSWNKITDLGLVPTPRSLWALCGFLYFVCTILVLPIRRLGYLRSFQTLLGKIADDGWDVPRSELLEPLQKGISLFRSFTNGWVHRNCWRIPKDPLILAFDATPSRWYVVKLAGNSYQPILHGDFSPPKEIDSAEGFGCCEAILFAVKEGASLCVLIGDNTPQLRAFYKAFSDSADLKELIAKSGVRDISFPIIFVDICTDDNIADIGTRPGRKIAKKEIQHRLEASVLRGQVALRRYQTTGACFYSRSATEEGAPLDSLQEAPPVVTE